MGGVDGWQLQHFAASVDAAVVAKRGQDPTCRLGKLSASDSSTSILVEEFQKRLVTINSGYRRAGRCPVSLIELHCPGKHLGGVYEELTATTEVPAGYQTRFDHWRCFTCRSCATAFGGQSYACSDLVELVATESMSQIRPADQLVVYQLLGRAFSEHAPVIDNI